MSLPNTFEKRGSTVHFRQPSLVYARLRRTGTDVDVVMPNPVSEGAGKGNRTFVVVGWRQIKSYSTLCDRDQALYDAISALQEQKPDEDLDPYRLQAVRLGVDGGREDGAAEAQATAVQDKCDRQAVFLSLLAQMTRECGTAMGDTNLAKAETELLAEAIGADVDAFALAANPLTRKVLDFAAGRTSTEARMIEARFRKLAQLMAPLGGINQEAGKRGDGYLARQRNDLARFKETMREIESTVDPALANPVAMIAFVAKQYIDYVDRRWDELEQKFSSFLLAVTRFKETMDFMLRVRRDVAYALDGWAPLIAHWDAVAEDDGPVRAAALLHILDNTPVMPEGELDPCPESKVMAQYEAARTTPPHPYVICLCSLGWR